MSDTTPERLRQQVADAGDPWQPDNVYFQRAEARMDAQWAGLVYPFIRHCDFSDTLDLACGHGRNSTKLLGLATRLTLIDVQPGNIEICRQRFRDHPNVTCLVGNGFGMQPIPDVSLTLIYCFDAMVHFYPEVVRSYLRDAARVLQRGGRAFMHHSNYPQTTIWWSNPHSRNTMTHTLFATYAEEAGLLVLQQKVLNWGSDVDLDCLSLVEKI
ncbi:MAG: hypothetical protein ABS99_04970 [Acetobacteraceae bacterium SCN 69-10]|nr:class I SAM-dependent methyltransferase [Rhodospirillales bacterium]ODU57394.1 MAG: hypothetical protein ABS99_04970 [Acetobacteraceae bacterium SCN 69-10]OJY70339.1 MAG: hypothetical protein BGP12_21570 [Rhodospirillales bacterium 70-18]